MLSRPKEDVNFKYVCVTTTAYFFFTSQLPSKLKVLKKPAKVPTKHRNMCNSAEEKEMVIAEQAF